MHALEEKNNLSNELTAVKKKLEDFGNQKVNLTYLYRIIFETKEIKSAKDFIWKKMNM